MGAVPDVSVHGQATHKIEVTAAARKARESDALTLEKGVFTKSTPRKIAISLKRSAGRSRRRKSNSYRSAMSMLTFFINRGGRGLSRSRKRKLEKAKDELRQARPEIPN